MTTGFFLQEPKILYLKILKKNFFMKMNEDLTSWQLGLKFIYGKIKDQALYDHYVFK